MKHILASLVAAICIGGLSFYAGRVTAPLGAIKLADHMLLEHLPLTIMPAFLSNARIVDATIVSDGTSDVYIGNVTFSER